jgi:hypothetical protein
MTARTASLLGLLDRASSAPGIEDVVVELQLAVVTFHAVDHVLAGIGEPA